MKMLLSIIAVCVAINCFAAMPQQDVVVYDGVIGGHEYVDLGLPSGTLWATYNVGASSPYEIGEYFAWGEIEPKEVFSWENYKHFINYYDPNKEATIVLDDIGEDISGSAYDAANRLWGNGWRLPNEQEKYELLMMCWWNRPVEENGVIGVRIHGPNEHSIFLPVCGFGLWDGEEPVNYTNGAYWTGVEDSLANNSQSITSAKSLFVDYYSGLTGAITPKADGLNIRAVINPKQSGISDIALSDRYPEISYRDGYIHVSGNENGEIEFYDLSGRHISTVPIVDGVCMLPDISNGIYLASYVQNGKKISTIKIKI